MIQTLSSRSKETGIGVGPDRFTGRAEQLPRNRLESQQITELLQDRQWINSPKQVRLRLHSFSSFRREGELTMSASSGLNLVCRPSLWLRSTTSMWM
jgi:hypothetical protein